MQELKRPAVLTVAFGFPIQQQQQREHGQASKQASKEASKRVSHFVTDRFCKQKGEVGGGIHTLSTPRHHATPRHATPTTTHTHLGRSIERLKKNFCLFSLETLSLSLSFSVSSQFPISIGPPGSLKTKRRKSVSAAHISFFFPLSKRDPHPKKTHLGLASESPFIQASNLRPYHTQPLSGLSNRGDAYAYAFFPKRPTFSREPPSL